jgi:hypothetical protein
LKSPLLKAYLEKLDLNYALNVTDKDYDKASIFFFLSSLIILDKIMKFITFANFPSIYDLSAVKACIHQFNKLKNTETNTSRTQDPGKSLSENMNKKAINMWELFLYLSFPLCPKDILNQIACYYSE